MTSMPLQFGKSFPDGVGEIGEQGCLCHGSSANATAIEFNGLPDKFESNVTYNLELKITNLDIEIDNESANGGFRILASSGEIRFNNSSDAQIIDDGWTHTNQGNKHRSWNFSWQSPQDNRSLVTMTIFANAVNGNGQSTGDNWNSMIIQIPGVENYDSINDKNLIKHELADSSKIILSLGLVTLLYLTVKIFKD